MAAANVVPNNYPEISSGSHWLYVPQLLLKKTKKKQNKKRPQSTANSRKEEKQLKP